MIGIFVEGEVYFVYLEFMKYYELVYIGYNCGVLCVGMVCLGWL